MMDEEDLHSAAKSGDAAAVARCLAAGISPEARDPNGNTPLVRCARYGSLEAAKALLKGGAAIESANADGLTSLIFAAKEGQLELVQFLLQAGANKEAKDSNMSTALLYASYHGHVEVVRVLLAAGCSKSPVNAFGARSRPARWQQAALSPFKHAHSLPRLAGKTAGDLATPEVRAAGLL